MAYAWSTILAGEKTIALGDSVTAADVGGKEEFENLKAHGVIRDAKYPVPEDVNESPVRHRFNELQTEIDELSRNTDASMADLALNPAGFEPGAEVEEVKK
jgi:hypothetical protein